MMHFSPVEFGFQPTGSINDVDVVIVPHGVCGGRLNGDSPLSLQLHGVHDSPDPVLALHLKDNTGHQDHVVLILLNTR